MTVVDKHTRLKRTIVVSAGSKIEAEKMAEQQLWAYEKIKSTRKMARSAGDLNA